MLVRVRASSSSPTHPELRPRRGRRGTTGRVPATVTNGLYSNCCGREPQSSLKCTTAYGCTSNAPTSHPSPAGRGSPRWSVVSGAPSASTQSTTRIGRWRRCPHQAHASWSVRRRGKAESDGAPCYRQRSEIQHFSSAAASPTPARNHHSPPSVVRTMVPPSPTAAPVRQRPLDSVRATLPKT